MIPTEADFEFLAQVKRSTEGKLTHVRMDHEACKRCVEAGWLKANAGTEIFALTPAGRLALERGG